MDKNCVARQFLLTPWLMVWVALGVGLLGVHSASSAQAAPTTLIYAGNLDGELEPCGCAETGNMGGLKRHVSIIDTLRQTTPELLLISSGGLLSSVHAHERITGQFILQGIEKIGYDAIGVQWADLAYGAAFVTPYSLPWVSSNWRDKSFAKERVVKKQGRHFAIFSWLDPETSPQSDIHAGGNPVDTGIEPIMESIRAAKKNGAITILLSTSNADKIAALFDLSHIDVVLQESGYEKFGAPELRNGTLFLKPGSRGMRFGRVDIEISAANRITAFKDEVITMPPEVADAPRMQEWYTAYNLAIKAAYQHSVEVRKAADSGSRPFIGAETCKNCHATEYSLWEKTRHAHAYDTLERVGKAFDEDCIGCHTVGFNRDGGFIDKDVTSHLLNVQCESCHGPGRDHASSAGKHPTSHTEWKPEQMCAQCHVPKHSPEFEFNRYWPKVQHGQQTLGEGDKITPVKK